MEELRQKLLDGQRMVLIRLKEQIQQVNVHVFKEKVVAELAKKRLEAEAAHVRIAVHNALAEQSSASSAAPSDPAPEPSPAPTRRFLGGFLG